MKTVLKSIILKVTVAGIFCLASGMGAVAQTSYSPTAVDITKTIHGPAQGSLIVIGGGTVVPEIWDRFIDLAGGKNARIVVVTNASGTEDYHSTAINELSSRLGKDRVTRLHLKDIDEANDDKLIECLKNASGVYFSGGRQWRISEIYLNTKAHREFFKLLERGGVIAGSSAGASIQGSFLWRGDTTGSDITVGDHTQGLGFMKYTVIDQHVLVRNRQHDLIAFIRSAPDYIGIGLDESTAIVVQGDCFEVIGKSYVAMHKADVENFFFLRAGQRFDMKSFSIITE